MTELERNLRNILSEKQNKIIPNNIKEGVQIYDVIGTFKGGTDTSDATATSDDILLGKTAYVNGAKLTGRHDDTYILTALQEINGRHI